MVPSLRYIKTILANTTNGARWHRMWKAKARAKGGLWDHGGQRVGQDRTEVGTWESNTV